MSDDAAFALMARLPPAVVASQSGAVMILRSAPAGMAYANDAAMRLFQAHDLPTLENIALRSTSPGARRLVALALEPAAQGQVARLELLRFFVRGLPMQATFNCVRVQGENGAEYLVACAPAAAAKPAAIVHKTAAPLPPSANAMPGGARAPAPARFVFALDADDRFLAPLEDFIVNLGDHAPRAGESLADLTQRIGFDLEAAFSGIVGARKTFSSLTLAWPLANGEHRSLRLSGAPQLDREQNYLGCRGFGLFAPYDGLIPGPAPPRAPEVSAPIVETALETKPEPAPAEPERGEAVEAPKAARSAAIVALRPNPPTPLAGQNVVSLRPAARAPDVPMRGDAPAPFAELTPDERDAFREIARALGAKSRAPESAAPERVKEPSPKYVERFIPHPPQPTDSRPAARPAGKTAPPRQSNAEELLNRLPIGALVSLGDEALYLNRTLLDLLGFEDIAAFCDAGGLARMFRGREPAALADADGAMSIIDAKGEILPVDAQIQPIKWDDAPASLISFRRALNPAYRLELRALEREGKALEAKLQDALAIAEFANDGAALLDGSGAIVSLSRLAETYFGYDQREIAGEEFLSLLAPSSHAHAKAAFAQLRQSPEALKGQMDVDVIAKRRDGRQPPARLRLGVVSSVAPIRYCAIFREASAPAQAAPEPAARTGDLSTRASPVGPLQSGLLTQTSHEIRTPLQAILGFSEVMVEERFGPLGNERYRQYARDIHASGTHVLNLVNDLLDLSKIEAGKLDLKFQSIDANQIIRESVALMQPQAERLRIIMRAALYEPLSGIIADERSLRQILLNLISNAIKYNQPGGQVIVSSAIGEIGQAVIRVRDTGVGMSRDDIGAAMQPFAQVGQKRSAGGTGLGLPLTKALVEANGAAFSIQSRPEQGTLIELSFPALQKAAQ